MFNWILSIGFFDTIGDRFMNTQQLKTFLTISKFGSFTKASEILDYSQSSVSAQIKALESEFNTKLFDRIGRSIILTDSGHRFIGYAEHILQLTNEVKEAISVESEPQGTLIIGAPETLCVFRLPDVLAAYRKRYPLVKLILKQGSCHELYEWAQRSIIDLAFVMDVPRKAPNLMVEKICIEPMTMIAEKNHPLSGTDAINPDALKVEDFILIDECSCCYRNQFENQLYNVGVQLNAFQEFGSVEMIKKTVSSGLGISLLPTVAVKESLKNGQLAALNWDTTAYNIYTQILIHKDKWQSPALEAFVMLIRELLSEPGLS